MTGAEWAEVVEWVDARFAAPWPIERARAYAQDLADYQAEDVWDALYRLYDRGLEFPPNGSQLRKETVEVVRARIERARLERQGLPADTSEDMTWEAWRDRIGYGGMTVEEATKESHRRQHPNGCPFVGCDVCGNLVEA